MIVRRTPDADDAASMRLRQAGPAYQAPGRLAQAPHGIRGVLAAFFSRFKDAGTESDPDGIPWSLRIDRTRPADANADEDADTGNGADDANDNGDGIRR